MKRSVVAVSALMLAVLGCFVAVAEEVPPLNQLRKPVEVTDTKEDGPVLPSAVGPERMVADLAKLCPEGAVWYVSVPDAGRLARDWSASPLGELVAEPAMGMMLKNNRFGLNYLFSDLPESVITPERVGAVASVMELSNTLAKNASKMSMACYIGDEGKFDFLFLFDIGAERVPAFETIGEWETFFFLTHPGSDVKRGNHSGNYLDVWQLREHSTSRRSAEIVAGFAENIAIVSNSPALAEKSLALLSGGANLADSQWGRRLAASQSTSSSTDAIAYLRMDELLRGLKDTPIAYAAVGKWADLLGHGGAENEAIYYGLEFTAQGARETFMLPASGQGASASLIELLSKRLRPAEKWNSTSVIPYQPNPALFLGANLDGRQLGGILRQDRRLFGSTNQGDAFVMPPVVRALFSNDLIGLLSGEIGMAFFPSADVKTSWMMVLPCTSSPERTLRKAVSMVERSGATIYADDGDWRNNVAWAAIPASRFRRLSGDFLIIASEGELILTAIDQMVGGSSFTANKDFSQALSASEGAQGMIFYMNMPEIVVRQYPNLSAIMRLLYPRSSGLNSRPPLALLRRHAKGVLGVIAPSAEGEEFTRVTVQSPLPTLGAAGASVVLGFPRSLRQDGRAAMETSRNNMQTIWLRLQLYASRFGHFPDTLEDIASDMRAPDVSNESIRAIFTAPAALSRMDPREASQKSFRYLSGITPSDEPDLPILYEAEAWSDDFTGQYPTDPSRSMSESGDFVPFRQYIRLDGKLVTMQEKRFVEKILPRIRERE